MTFIYFIAGLLAASCFMCLYRIGHGPTASDRSVAIDIFGTVVVGFVCLERSCAHACKRTSRSYFAGRITKLLFWRIK